MTQGPESVEGSLEQAIVTAIRTASEWGKQLAKHRDEQIHRAQSQGEPAARSLATQLGAERDQARATLAPVHDQRWWDSAGPQQVQQVVATAEAWAPVDPTAREAQKRVADEVRTRFGVDLTNPNQAAAKTQADADRALNGSERNQSLAGRDRAEGNVWDREAVTAEQRAQDHEDRGEHAAAAQERAESTHAAMHAETAYDSADRRTELAANLKGIGNDRAAQARVLADTAQARPATHATKGAQRVPPKPTRAPRSPAKAPERTARGA